MLWYVPLKTARNMAIMCMIVKLNQRIKLFEVVKTVEPETCENPTFCVINLY